MDQVGFWHGMEATLPGPYIALERNSGIFKNKGTFLWNFSQTLNLAHFSVCFFFAKTCRSSQVLSTYFDQ